MAASIHQKSFANKSTFLQLPYEIRLHVYSYLLPYSISSRNRRGLKTVWYRGNTAILATNLQIYEETSALLYGNLFEVDIGYGHIIFQFRRQLPSGLVPRDTPDFLSFFSKRNIKQIQKWLINVDHVDNYTAPDPWLRRVDVPGMIKYNCGGAGLSDGLRKQVCRVVDVLNSVDRLLYVQVNMRDWDTNAESGQGVLEPFQRLKHANDLVVTGNVTTGFAQWLKDSGGKFAEVEHTKHSHGQDSRA